MPESAERRRGLEKRSVRSPLHVDRAEGDVVGFEQLDLLARAEAGVSVAGSRREPTFRSRRERATVLADDVAADAMASEIVGDQVALPIVGQVPAADDLQTAQRRTARVQASENSFRCRCRRRPAGKPYLEYEIDREAAARYGVSIRDIQDVIEIAIGGERLTTTVEGRERYPIRVRYPRELRERFDDLEHILVPTSTGAHVPIAQVAKLSFSIGPQEIKSENGLLVGYVTLNTRDRDEISVVEEAERLLQSERKRSDVLVAAGRLAESALGESGLHSAEASLIVPPGYYWTWSGQFENQRRAMERLSLLVPLVLLSMMFATSSSKPA